MVTRFAAGLVQAYDFSAGAVRASDVVPTVTFPVPGVADVTPDSCAVAPDLSRAVYVTPDRLTCVDRAGATVWQLDFPPAASERANAQHRCDFSLDGTVVWIYRPDGLARVGVDDGRT
ncbi:hypothetical protein AWW66_26175 [Micromonospora rosaria]|uniref:Lipoprotein LpqB beta-propeller domain-containing protein n=1 Tax=Micromonospora rosaria TaxID=47874 RepID=A0A136PL28_9ACTN|nr:hypothetical protein AWW66_26175 [Micromonospora rosaria]